MAKTMRIATAFLAGVLVALAGAIIYVKTTSVRALDVRPINQPIQPMQQAPGKEIVVDAPSPKAVVASAPEKPVPVRFPVPHVVTTKRVAIPVHHRPPVHTEKSLVAESTAPPSVIPAAPAVAAPVIANSTPDPQVPSGPGPQYDSGRPQNGALDPATPDFQTPGTPAAATPRREPMSVTLEAGTPLSIRLGETLSTNTNYTGDTFRGTLESPIIRDGYIIADRGSRVLGTIVSAHKAGRMSGEPEVTLALTEINTTDGQSVHVQTNSVSRAGPSSTPENTAKLAAGAAIGAIIGAIAGGGKGAAIGAGAGGAAGTGVAMAGHSRPAVIQTETPLTFQLAQPVTITEKLN